jgi:hypothetical protein
MKTAISDAISAYSIAVTSDHGRRDDFMLLAFPLGSNERLSSLSAFAFGPVNWRLPIASGGAHERYDTDARQLRALAPVSAWASE